MLFDDIVVFDGTRGTRPIALTLSVCIVDDGCCDPLNQTNAASDMDALCVYIRRDDWPEVAPPQIGDAITTEMGAQYAVRKVGRLADVWVLSARRK